MRPPEFTGGNSARSELSMVWSSDASMRPPEFTGGNSPGSRGYHGSTARFNEAAGIHRRKLTE